MGRAASGSWSGRFSSRSNTRTIELPAMSSSTGSMSKRAGPRPTVRQGRMATNVRPAASVVPAMITGGADNGQAVPEQRPVEWSVEPGDKRAAATRARALRTSRSLRRPGCGCPADVVALSMFDPEGQAGGVAEASLDDEDDGVSLLEGVAASWWGANPCLIRAGSRRTVSRRASGIPELEVHRGERPENILPGPCRSSRTWRAASPSLIGRRSGCRTGGRYGAGQSTLG